MSRADEILANAYGHLYPEEAGAAPTWAELTAFVSSGDCPPEALAEFGSLLGPVFPNMNRPVLAAVFSHVVDYPGVAQELARRGGFEHGGWDAIEGALDAEERLELAGWLAFVVAPVEMVGEAWNALPQDTRPEFPYAPLLRAWHNRPRLVDPDTRPYGIVPNTIVKRRHAKPKKNAPELPGFEGIERVAMFTTETAFLPGLAPPGREAIPAILDLLDGAGLRSNSRRMVNASWTVRLAIEILTAVPVRQRGNGLISLTVEEHLDWLLSDWTMNNRLRSRLGEAVRGISAIRTPYTGTINGRRFESDWLAPVVVRGLGEIDFGRLGRRDSVLYHVMLSDGTHGGPMVNRPLLRHYGRTSAPKFRAYLAACYHWNERGTHGGKLIEPTRPVVVKDAEGYPLDANGKRLLRKRGRNVVPIADAYHPLAIRTGEREPNPAAEKYGLLKAFTPDDLAYICYSPADRESAGRAERSLHRHRAVRAFEEMAEDGAIVLEEVGAGAWRILRPEGFGNQ